MGYARTSRTQRFSTTLKHSDRERALSRTRLAAVEIEDEMLIFLDTEFTDFIDCDLISIGMVSEDGQHELYLERSDYRAEWCNSFVHAAVLPQLGGAGPAFDRLQLAARLVGWFAT